MNKKYRGIFSKIGLSYGIICALISIISFSGDPELINHIPFIILFPFVVSSFGSMSIALIFTGCNFKDDYCTSETLVGIIIATLLMWGAGYLIGLVIDTLLYFKKRNRMGEIMPIVIILSGILIASLVLGIRYILS